LALAKKLGAAYRPARNVTRRVLHLGAPQWRGRDAGQTGVSTPRTSCREVRNSAMRWAFWLQRSSASGSVPMERSASHASMGPDAAQPASATPDFLQQLPIARSHVAEDDVAVAGHRTWCRRRRRIRAQRQRPLPQRRCRGVVHRDQSARAKCAFSQRAAMSQISMVGLLASRSNSRRAPSRCSPCASPAVAQGGRTPIWRSSPASGCGGKVGVGGQHGDVAGPQHGAETAAHAAIPRRRPGVGAVALALVRRPGASCPTRSGR